jgi:LCP family protein required for cell wall assembly
MGTGPRDRGGAPGGPWWEPRDTGAAPAFPRSLPEGAYDEPYPYREPDPYPDRQRPRPSQPYAEGRDWAPATVGAAGARAGGAGGGPAGPAPVAGRATARPAPDTPAALRRPRAGADPAVPPPSKRGARRARRTPPTRAQRLRRTLLAVTAAGGVLMLIVGSIAFAHLNGNLRSDRLFAGASGDAGKETADARGRLPMNILVIGSDTRASAVDCQIGGGCGGGGANADVQMLVHVSADRSNATVMSIPRDIVTDLPACVGPKGARSAAHAGQINSTLAYGPGCTVAAVHKLTGIPIDHFVMVDFGGVIAMSDAVGGATICVSDNVFDTYSGLKLKKGTHTLKGLAALQFVRSRHGFGDGSDLGRTYAQHLFLSAVIRNIKSAGTLTNAGKLYSLADAATKALTVDSGLASIPSLLALASDINRVPTNRITFTTMQNEPDPSNPARVIVKPAAKDLFAAIRNDQSLSAAAPGAKPAGSPTPTPSASSSPAPTTPPPAKSTIAVRVENASGRTGRASQLTQFLISEGFSKRTTYVSGSLRPTTTVLKYGTDMQAQAQVVADALRLPGSALKQATGSGLTLVIGTDWASGTAFPGAAGTPAPVDTTSALSDTHAQTANQATGCAPVSTYPTSLLNGAAMTPSRAYAVASYLPDSAP